MINLIQGFNIGSALPIDGRILLTKAEMKALSDNIMPDKYFAICKDDGLIYLYNKSATVSEETGKFSKATPEKVSQLENDENYDVVEDAVAREKVVKDYVTDNYTNTTDLNTLLQSYSLVSETGNKLKLNYDESTYKFSVELLDKNDNSLSVTKVVDLPFGTVVVGGRYDSESKEVVLVLKNGDEIKFSISSLISGLVNTETFEGHTTDTGIHTNTSEKETWNAKYNKPSDGIPSGDLSSSVNELLVKAGTAIQQSDLDTNYYTKSETELKLSYKQDKILAGNNITIDEDGKTINAVDTTYTAGTGININNNVISATASAPNFDQIGGDPKDNDKLKEELEKLAIKSEVEASLALKADLSAVNEHINNTGIHVTEAQKSSWTAKYSKPDGGIPKSDLSSGVQSSLDLADSAIQEHQSLSAYRTSSDQDLIDDTKVDKITGKGLSTNDYTTEEKDKLSNIEQGAQVNTITGVSVNGIEVGIENKKAIITDMASASELEEVQEKIPSTATATNQLADKDFVNSSIATSTATFRGTSETGLTYEQFIAWADAIENKDKNDYVFWDTTDSSGNRIFKRYKYTESGSELVWSFEYELNNSSFTASQWASINSGITSDLVTQITTNKTNITSLTSDKVDKVSGKSLVSDDEITKLEGVSEEANKVTVNIAGSGNIEIDGSSKNIYTHPSYSEVSTGFNKLASNTLGHVISSTPVVASDITNLVNYTAGSGLKVTTSGTTNTFSQTYYSNISLSSASWTAYSESGTTLYYYQTASVSGVTSDSHPILDVIIDKASYGNVDAINEAWSKIYSAETDNGTITFYATEAPSTNLNIQAKGY